MMLTQCHKGAKVRKYFFIVVILFCITTLYANEDKAIKDALLKYNYGIIKMGLSGKTDFFKEFLKKEEAIKLQVWFESWKFSNLTYVARINDLRFSPIVYNENNATIRTLENWTFSYVNLATRKVALEPITMFYKMRYTLKKHDGKWMIVAIKVLKEKIFENKKSHTPEPKGEETKDDVSNK